MFNRKYIHGIPKTVPHFEAEFWNSEHLGVKNTNKLSNESRKSGNTDNSDIKVFTASKLSAVLC